MKILDSKIRRHPSPYFIQCGFAAIILTVVFIMEDVLAYAAVLAAIGSTTFVVFVMPSNPNAAPRRIIGGHLVGVIVGSLCAVFLSSALGSSLEDHIPYLDDIVAAQSVAIAIFLMALTDTEHPPAAGTALGLVLVKWDARVALFILAAAVVLALARTLLRPWLRDLT